MDAPEEFMISDGALAKLSPAELQELLLDVPKVRIVAALSSLPSAMLRQALANAGLAEGRGAPPPASPSGRPFRRQTLQPATAVYNDWMSTADCLIRNRSDSGFLLEAKPCAGLPDAFDLMVPADDATFPVRVVWRSGNQLGVAVTEH